MTLTYGVAALARPTFDVPFAEAMKDRAFAALDAAGIATVGPRALLFDGPATEKALAEIKAAGKIDLLLILQVTFTDASMTVKIAEDATTPIAVWALPEPRLGGRLRLNALCGINLAAHALGRVGKTHGALYARPDAPGLGDSLRGLARPVPAKPTRAAPVAVAVNAEAERVLAALKGAKISVVGQHPHGFHTCEYDAGLLKDMVGLSVETVTLDRLFAKAKATDAGRVAGHRATAGRALAGIDDMNQEQLDKSLRVFCALEDVKRETGAKGLAVRCWPEMFTEYGCAACGPMAMMNEARVPSACEADVNGALSQLMLQELAGEPAWMADLVDLDTADDTAVMWHCGLAPLSMRDPAARAEATIHTNRKMPLLHQFPLKPGRITLARISQARNRTKMTLAGAEVVRAPMAFTGTSGVIRFDRSAGEVFETIMDEALEHHFALAYGEHRPALRAIAQRLNLPVLELA
jgi:L-fucose isomerase-like protein